RAAPNDHGEYRTVLVMTTTMRVDARAHLFNQTVKAMLNRFVRASLYVLDCTRIGRYAQAQMIEGIRRRTREVEYRGVRLVLSVPNALNQFRAQTFSTKEPETLEWIDTMARGAVMWDIGANVGLYSCYAAKSRGCRVFAFEPSVFNLETLAR